MERWHNLPAARSFAAAHTALAAVVHTVRLKAEDTALAAAARSAMCRSCRLDIVQNTDRERLEAVPDRAAVPTVRPMSAVANSTAQAECLVSAVPATAAAAHFDTAGHIEAPSLAGRRH